MEEIDIADELEKDNVEYERLCEAERKRVKSDCTFCGASFFLHELMANPCGSDEEPTYEEPSDGPYDGPYGDLIYQEEMNELMASWEYDDWEYDDHNYEDMS